MTLKVDNHYIPVFTCRYWKDKDNEWSFRPYSKLDHNNMVIENKIRKGERSWGSQKHLYTQDLEDRLDVELEAPASKIYKKLISGELLTWNERLKWAQFLITQAVRTPSFFKYRDEVETYINGDFSYKESILGCVNCDINKLVAERNWWILKAHEEDYFIRTDNPVYLTGCIENPDTTIFYPLTPNLCFVMCSLIPLQMLLRAAYKGLDPQQEYFQLGKSDAHAINFELLKSASRSVILRENHNSEMFNYMARSVMGVYPQIPYLMMSATDEISQLKVDEELTSIMSRVDCIDYPIRDYSFKPFFGGEFSLGINPFSVFGVTEDLLVNKENE